MVPSTSSKLRASGKNQKVIRLVAGLLLVSKLPASVSIN